MYITRIAPSPTGQLHLGTARTAYFNYLAARASKGKFILRIDDTDTERNRKEYTQIILDSLEWLGLEYDEVFYQSKREDLYRKEAEGLRNKGQAVELSNGAIALRFPSDMPPSFKDLNGDIKITDTNKAQIHEKVILTRGIDKEGSREKLGQPTYQLATVIDDYFMGINYIIRGTDHITNTPKQIAIWVALNNYYSGLNSPKLLPRFAHVGLIHKDKKKLSKRDGASSVLGYKEQGYSPEALLDFVLRMGWSTGTADTPKKITKKEAIELFLKGNLRAASSNFDQAKLDHLNKLYR